jgi:hypothetical protein
VFDSQLFAYQHPLMNSCTLAQLLLCGISIKPVLYAVLFLPDNVLLQWKCYTSIGLAPTNMNDDDDDDDDDDPFLDGPSIDMYALSTRCADRYAFRLLSFYPRLQFKRRTLSNPILPSTVDIHRDQATNARAES